MSTIKVGTKWINMSSGLYRKSKRFNSSHDLRMLMVTLSNRNPYFDSKGIIKTKILKILRSIILYVDQSIRERRHPFHITYDMYNIVDKNFTPKNIIKIIKQDISNISILNDIKPKKALGLNKNRRYVIDFKKYLSKSYVR